MQSTSSYVEDILYHPYQEVPLILIPRNILSNHTWKIKIVNGPHLSQFWDIKSYIRSNLWETEISFSVDVFSSPSAWVSNFSFPFVLIIFLSKSPFSSFNPRLYSFQFTYIQGVPTMLALNIFDFISEMLKLEFTQNNFFFTKVYCMFSTIDSCPSIYHIH